MSKKDKFNPVLNGNPELDENVQPIKKRIDRVAFKNYWLQSKSRLGFRNWVIFETGICTGLRASDLVRLQYKQVYKPDGTPRPKILGEKDQKTDKINRYLDIKWLKPLLVKYNRWLDNHYKGKWLFYKATDKRSHITAHYLYQIMRRAGDKLGIKHVGSHSLRKTFGYLAYKQTGNILYVMKRLDQSDPRVTLRYIDCDEKTMDSITDTLDFK